MKNLKDLRNAKGLTQVQVAREVGVSIAAYLKWEQEVGKPNEENMKKLLKVLGLKKGE